MEPQSMNVCKSLNATTLFTRILALPEGTKIDKICPKDELSTLFNALCSCLNRKQTSDTQWTQLLRADDVQILSGQWSWQYHLCPILGFKLFVILSGITGIEGTTPRSIMSPDLKSKLERIARLITRDEGWPKVFEEAITARWNNLKNPEAPLQVVFPNLPAQSPAQNGSLKMAVAHNLKVALGFASQQSKLYSNIIRNIQLAATYLGIMTMGVVDVITDKDFTSKLDQCMAGLNFSYNASDLMKQLRLSLVELQAPLFCALSISPILLFRTCLLQSSRFGRNHYVSFLLSLGNIKPQSLRTLETLIWKDLFLVAQCQLEPQDMVDHVLDSIVEPSILSNFRFDTTALRCHFKEKFEPIRDHTSFFFPDCTRTGPEKPSDDMESLRQLPITQTDRLHLHSFSAPSTTALAGNSQSTTNTQLSSTPGTNPNSALPVLSDHELILVSNFIRQIILNRPVSNSLMEGNGPQTTPDAIAAPSPRIESGSKNFAPLGPGFPPCSESNIAVQQKGSGVGDPSHGTAEGQQVSLGGEGNLIELASADKTSLPLLAKTVVVPDCANSLSILSPFLTPNLFPHLFQYHDHPSSSDNDPRPDGDRISQCQATAAELKRKLEDEVNRESSECQKRLKYEPPVF